MAFSVHAEKQKKTKKKRKKREKRKKRRKQRKAREGGVKPYAIRTALSHLGYTRNSVFAHVKHPSRYKPVYTTTIQIERLYFWQVNAFCHINIPVCSLNRGV